MKRLSHTEWHQLSEDFFMHLRYWRLANLSASRKAIAAELDARWAVARQQILDDFELQGVEEANKAHPCPYCQALLPDAASRLHALRTYASPDFVPAPFDRTCTACGNTIPITQRKRLGNDR